jgi:hypothetical protein
VRNTKYSKQASTETKRASERAQQPRKFDFLFVGALSSGLIMRACRCVVCNAAVGRGHPGSEKFNLRAKPSPKTSKRLGRKHLARSKNCGPGAKTEIILPAMAKCTQPDGASGGNKQKCIVLLCRHTSAPKSRARGGGGAPCINTHLISITSAPRNNLSPIPPIGPT